MQTAIATALTTASHPATTPVPSTALARPDAPEISSLDVSGSSTWISRVVFVRARSTTSRRDKRFLAFYLKDGRALLYSDGPRRRLPLSLREIFTGTLAAHCGLSVGAAYTRLVKGNRDYRSQTVSAAELDTILSSVGAN